MSPSRLIHRVWRVDSRLPCASKRRIVLGRTVQSLVLVENGLQAGDQIILTNLDILEDRSKVDVQQSKKLADELALMQVPLVVPRVAKRDQLTQDGDGQ